MRAPSPLSCPHPGPSQPGQSWSSALCSYFSPLSQAKPDAPEPQHPACTWIPPLFQGTLLQKMVINRIKYIKELCKFVFNKRTGQLACGNSLSWSLEGERWGTMGSYGSKGQRVSNVIVLAKNLCNWIHLEDFLNVMIQPESTLLT